MKKYEFNGQIFNQTRKSEIIVNAGGGSISDATEIFGANQVDCIQNNLEKMGKYGMVETVKYEATVFEKDGKFYERVGFEHFNGHFSGFSEGVYDVRFRELKPE